MAQVTGFRVQGLRFRAQGLGFTVQVSRFRILGCSGFGFRVSGQGSHKKETGKKRSRERKR